MPESDSAFVKLHRIAQRYGNSVANANSAGRIEILRPAAVGPTYDSHGNKWQLTYTHVCIKYTASV